MVGIDPHAQLGRLVAGALGDQDLAFVEPEDLVEWLPWAEGPGIQRDAHRTELHQTTGIVDILAPGIGLADVEERISPLLDPDIEPDVAIADGHRLQGRWPRH